MWSLGYSGCLAVSSEGQSGGLGLFWMSSMCVDIKGFNSRCIDALVTPDDGQPWRISFMYGEPRRDQRHVFWDLLRSMRASWSGAWICYGDFNEVLSQDEHVGPRDRTEGQIAAF
jgi:hypothetical protein